LKPKILGPWLVEHWLLPTQVALGEGQTSIEASTLFPYYDELISAIRSAGFRPNIPEYPQIAHYIKEALDSIYYGTKDPKGALDDAAAKSAVILGWGP
jgi:multiple sugar transport system substrate-binding protein